MMNWTTMRSGMIAAAMLFAAGAHAQTTNAWTLTSGTADWNTGSNWDPAVVPDGISSVAIFTNAYTANIAATVSSDVTLNRLLFWDTDVTHTNTLTISGRRIAFDGVSPSIILSNSYFGQILLNSTVRVDGVTLTLGGRSGSVNKFGGPIEGNGTLYIDAGYKELNGMNSNFTGTIIVRSRIAGDTGTSVQNSTGGLTGYWSYGDTNGDTRIYDRANIMLMPYSAGASNAEPIRLYGIYDTGSIRFLMTTNLHYSGVVTLYTNSSIGMQPDGGFAGAGHRRDLFVEGPILDDGNNRGIHFINNPTGTNLLGRLSQIVYSGQATYGGFTHLTSQRTFGVADLSGAYDGYLQLTNGNNRLPVGTTLYLGGLTNSSGINIGQRSASGILVLAGANQELAGLYLMALGTGVNNRVVGGTPTNNTLTLNIGVGRTNLYGGYLGGAGVNENNLALTKKGTGFLNLTNLNTSTGPTTVEAGTLRIGGSHVGDMTVKTGGALNIDGTHTLGLITVENGGILGGVGTVGAITSTGTVSPGNSVGTLTANGNVTLGAGATLLIEINEYLGDDYDKLVLAGGGGNNALNLNGSPNLTLSLNYTPGMGEYFTIVSGFADFIPFMDGAFSGKSDGGTFVVNTTTFQIDYNQNDITLTVVPEPQTLGLLGLAALGGFLRRRIRR